MIKEIIFLTLIFELFTFLGRFVFGPIKKYYKRYKISFHLHHAYVGLILILLYFYFDSDVYGIIGFSLFFSDIIHHIWLKIHTGDSGFP